MTDKLSLAKKLLTFSQNENLALFDELREINATLSQLLGKENIQLSIENTAEKIDLSQTNELLKQLIEKEKEDIIIDLKIV